MDKDAAKKKKIYILIYFQALIRKEILMKWLLSKYTGR